MFDDVAARADHFQRHGRDFRANTAEEYERMAREFLNEPLRASVEECVRRNGDTIRFDTATQAFAVMRSDGVIKTFYKADVTWHGYRTNLLYFRVECAK
jgi:filamentous hemagglutinin